MAANSNTKTNEPAPAEPSRTARPWYRRDPWTDRLPFPLARLERDFEHLMERVFGSETRRSTCWADFGPAVSLAETEDRYEINAELPGMSREEVRVELRNGDLWISGEKKNPEQETGKTLHRVEQCYGEFRRAIPLPGAVDEAKIEAAYRDGILKVTLPKSKEARPRRIEVKS
ncbi:MAG TPA: Hsp20/alpha crystallin family protein [Pirellulales bacterium]|nr:Hsp20/alpha crystallin family protein [Pirellulales bacterium]